MMKKIIHKINLINYFVFVFRSIFRTRTDEEIHKKLEQKTFVREMCFSKLITSGFN